MTTIPRALVATTGRWSGRFSLSRPNGLAQLSEQPAAGGRGTYFPGLNSLRALGALCVIPGHIEEMKQFFGFPFARWFPISGVIGVILFFTLSGYLITYLLLQERRTEGRISIVAFYVRRMLRIWPLYFLIVLSAIFVFPKVPWSSLEERFRWPGPSFTTANVALYLLLMPHFSMAPILFAGQTWSIGFEEHFYLFQPWLVKFFRRTPVLIGVMLLICCLPDVCNLVFDRMDRVTDSEASWGKDWNEWIRWFATQTVYFGCIAIGCIFGVLRFKARPKTMKWLFSRRMQLFALGTLGFLFCVGYAREFHRDHPDFRSNAPAFANDVDPRLWAVLFGIVILNVSSNPASLAKFSSRILDYLGRISYGLYMYHPICIGLVLTFVNGPLRDKRPHFLVNALGVLATLGLTILVSALSYRLFEGPLLRLKPHAARGRASEPS